MRTVFWEVFRRITDVRRSCKPHALSEPWIDGCVPQCYTQPYLEAKKRIILVLKKLQPRKRKNHDDDDDAPLKKKRKKEVVLQPPPEKGDSVECSMVSAEGGPIEWHSGKVISVNATRKRLTVRATVDGDIQVEKYKFSEEGTEWRRRPGLSFSLISEPKALATASAAGLSREKEKTKGTDKSESKKACPGLQVGAIIECAFDDEEKGIQWLSSTVQAVHPGSHKFKVLVQVKTQEEEGKWHETFQFSDEGKEWRWPEAEMHGNNGKERDENQKVQKGKEEVLLQPTPEKCASVEVSTLLSSSNLRPLLSSPSLVSDPEALTTASAPCMSKVEKDETKCNDKSETKKARPGLQVGILVSTCSPMAVPLFLDEGKELTGLEAEVQGSKGKERGDEVVLQPPLEKGDSVECSLVSAEGGPIEWHSGTVISVNAKLKSLTVRATVDGDIQVETYKFSEEGTEWRRPLLSLSKTHLGQTLKVDCGEDGMKEVRLLKHRKKQVFQVCFLSDQVKMDIDFGSCDYEILDVSLPGSAGAAQFPSPVLPSLVFLRFAAETESFGGDSIDGSISPKANRVINLFEEEGPCTPSTSKKKDKVSEDVAPGLHLGLGAMDDEGEPLEENSTLTKRERRKGVGATKQLSGSAAVMKETTGTEGVEAAVGNGSKVGKIVGGRKWVDGKRVKIGNARGRDVVEETLHACVDLHASIETLIVGSCTKTKERERKGVEEGRHGTGAEEGSNGGGSTLRPIGASQGKERNLAEKEQDHALESEDKDKDDREDLVKKVEQKEPWEENDGTVRVALLRFPERIKLLEEYKAEHGHVHISHQHTFPNGQRNYFSNEWRVRYRKGNLEPGVQQRLEGLGFEWDGTTARRLREEAQSAR